MDSVAERYHSLTNYTAEGVSSGPGIDWSARPPQVKEIVSQVRISLREHLPRLPDGDPEPEPVTSVGLPALSRLLLHTNGVTGLIRYQQAEGQILRAAPSAGALYPTEVYVCARSVPGIEPGLYNYQVADHELVHLWEGDQTEALRDACGADARFDNAPLCLVLTGIFWRSAWRYQERGYRRVLLDTGHVLGNLATYAPQVGLTAHPFLSFMDHEVNGLFFFDENVEAALVCVPLTEEPGACVPGSLWTAGIADPEGVRATALRREQDLAGSATARMHDASSCPEKRLANDADRLEPPVSDRSIPLAPPEGVDAAIPQAILHRRSARAYSGKPVALDALGHALGFALGRRAARRSIHFATRDAGVMRAHVVALDVDGLDAGHYAVEGAGEALLPLSIGDRRSEIFQLALGQEIAQKCSAVLAFDAPIETALDLYGERAYRHLHIEAGVIGERFQLAARALGLDACAIGGFFDADAAKLLGTTEAESWVLFFVTIGRA